MGPDDGCTTYVLGDYFRRKAATHEAKMLALAWEKQRDAPRAAEESRKKPEAASKPESDR